MTGLLLSVSDMFLTMGLPARGMLVSLACVWLYASVLMSAG